MQRGHAKRQQRKREDVDWLDHTRFRHTACPDRRVIDVKPALTRAFRVPSLLWNAVSSWIADGRPRLGAAVAFYSIFALAPLLIVATAIAGAVFGFDDVRSEFATQLAGLVGRETGQSLERLTSSSWPRDAGGLAGVIGAWGT